MKVMDDRSVDVGTCHVEDPLTWPTRVMWEQDCGCVPVVDDEQHVIGMITDRDICMAAYSQGRPLGEMTVDSAMARNIVTCRQTDELSVAHERMREHQLRRLPVVDDDDLLVGLVTLADIARVTSQGATKAARQKGAEALLQTLAAVSKPRVGLALEVAPASGE